MATNKNMTKVVVIGDQAHALGILRSLGRKGIPCYLLNDSSVCIGKFSRYCSKFIKMPDINDETVFLKFLEKNSLGQGLEGAIIMPTDDATVSLLSKYKHSLEKTYKIPTPIWDITKFAIDKRLTYQIAKKNNIPVPRTIFPKNLEELYEELPTITFPAILKPAIMHHFYKKTKKKVVKTDTKDELIRAYKEVSSIIDPSEIMIQEIIQGGPELLYSFCSFFKQKKVMGMLIARRTRQKPMDFGVGSTFVETIYIPELEELGTRLLTAIDYYGLSEIEFKMDPIDGKFKLLEINARTWKWHTLAIQAGVDFPYLLYQDMMGEEVKSIISFKENIKWLDIIRDTEVVIGEVLNGNMKLREYLRSLKGKKEYATFSMDDALPFIIEAILVPYRLVQKSLKNSGGEFL